MERWMFAAAAVLIAAVMIVRSWLRERRQNRLPTIRIRAEITGIRLENRTVNGAYGRTNLIGHHVTFRTAEGEPPES